MLAKEPLCVCAWLYTCVLSEWIEEAVAPSLFISLIGLGDGLMSVYVCICVCKRGAVGDPPAQWDSPGAHSAAVGFPRSHNDAGRATCKSPKWHNCQCSQV